MILRRLLLLAALGCSGDELAAATFASTFTDAAAKDDSSHSTDDDAIGPADAKVPGAGSDDASSGSDHEDASDANADSEPSGEVQSGDAGELTEGDAGVPSAACPAGLAGCVDGDRLVCNAAGTAYERSDCATGHCLDGACVDCDSTSGCKAPLECRDGQCELPPLVALAGPLPTGLLNSSYTATLLATGGSPPYVWSSGNVPAGLSLAADGVLSGIPTAEGPFELEATVSDQGNDSDAGTWTFEIVDGTLIITTPSPLPKAIEGDAYTLKLAADGGTAPYFWGLVAGALPGGLALGSNGVIAGTPVEGGDFVFTVKALDNATPTSTAEKVFTLPIGLSPLEITGEQSVDLFVTKLITLPLIVVVNGIPIPYNASLTAKGGKKPYHWAQEPLPGFINNLIPGAGLPAGLTLADNGQITGGVTDPSLVTSVTIPFTQIALKGFFFSARVSDSQSSPESQTALFYIPTVPLGP